MSRAPSPCPIGEKFGEWTVLGDTSPQLRPSGRPERRFLCECSCGTIRPVIRATLLSGGSLSCHGRGTGKPRKPKPPKKLKTPVARTEPMPPAEPKPIKRSALAAPLRNRKTYGDLQYIGMGTPHLLRSGEVFDTWRMQCTCGNEFQRVAIQVYRGQVTHCGCKKGEPDVRPQFTW